MQQVFKKMAGTSAVFVAADHAGPSPVERDGLSWTAQELGLDTCPRRLRWREPMDSSLALEGTGRIRSPAAGRCPLRQHIAVGIRVCRQDPRLGGDYCFRLNSHDGLLTGMSPNHHATVMAAF